MMKTRALPLRRRPQSSKVRSTTLLTVIGGVSIPLGVRPRVRVDGVGLRIELVQNARWHGRISVAPLRTFCQTFVQKLLHVSMNGIELAFGFQFDFQFSNVEVLGVVEFPKQNGVHQLGDPLRDLPGVPLLGDLEENDIRGHAGVDGVEQVADAVVAGLVRSSS